MIIMSHILVLRVQHLALRKAEEIRFKRDRGLNEDIEKSLI